MRIPDITPLLRAQPRSANAPPAVLQALAGKAGITFNGNAPWDIQVHDPERHYDVGNDVFEAMLDSSMIYSCAYWKDANDLEQAQRDKLRLIWQKLDLRKGERLLDIGCG